MDNEYGQVCLASDAEKENTTSSPNMNMGSSRTSIQARLLALAALSMGFSMMSSVFSFYYVKCFLNYFHIKESWFQFAQSLYLVWNTVNDPLFAYFQDNTNFRCTRTRRESILYASPFFALSFLVPWFPWGDPDTVQAWVTGIHLITALCLWDTMFTYVGLATCCLYTEISLEYTDRVRAMWYGQISGLIGSMTVFVVQYLSNGLEHFHVFQTTCVVIAVISCLLMRYCGLHAHTERELTGEKTTDCTPTESYLTVTKQLLTNRDLISFVVTNFFQDFHKTYLHSFLAIFCDQLIPKGAIPELVRSIFYGGSFMISKIAALYGLSIVHKYGYYSIMRLGFLFKIILGFMYLHIGPINHWCLILFFIVDGCTVDGINSFFNLPLSDVTDSDARKYNRRNPITSMIYGTNALVVKPALSLCPMFIVAALNSYGYESLKRGSLDPGQQKTLNDVMFKLVCLFPLVLGCIQSVTWSFYTIRNSNKKDVTRLVNDQGQMII